MSRKYASSPGVSIYDIEWRPRHQVIFEHVRHNSDTVEPYRAHIYTDGSYHGGSSGKSFAEALLNAATHWNNYEEKAK